MIPDLVDGRDIFLREGEKIAKVRFVHDMSIWWYTSNLSPIKTRGTQTYVLCFRMGPEPGTRISQYVNLDQLIFEDGE